MADQYKVSRDEFFSTKKCIVIEMDKRDYVAIKTMLLNHKNISLMRLFKKIAEDVAKGSPYAQKIIKEIVDEQFHKELARLEASAGMNYPPQVDYSTIDRDRMYDLISHRLGTKNVSADGEDDKEK